MSPPLRLLKLLGLEELLPANAVVVETVVAVAAVVVAAAAVVADHCRIDLKCSKRISVVVVVAAAVAVGVAAVLLKDWMMTVETFSKDEILSPQRRRPAGVETWWSTCCTALLTWPAGCRADRDGPVKQKSTIS